MQYRLSKMEKPPQIIALQEVKPNNYRYERIRAEYELEGYEIIEQNLFNETGRGLMIYIKSGLRYNGIELKIVYNEYCCVEVMCNTGKLLLTSIYRSPGQ